ncbi:hypothetical protein, partial [Streptomyces sp. SID10692]|uniref:hypothetical protein n=1 Tax=Streptomyces sp. SID10692 TaxID=2706026 RepID=UPI001943E6BC
VGRGRGGRRPYGIGEGGGGCGELAGGRRLRQGRLLHGGVRLGVLGPAWRKRLLRLVRLVWWL